MSLHPLRSASLLAALLLAPAAAAQVSHGGTPPSLAHPLSGELATAVMPPVDVESLLLEDALAGKDQPLRFGELLPVDLGLANAGRWEELADGSRVWRLAIASEGARSISLTYDRWLLPDGGEFFVRNAGGSMVIGAFTSAHNRPHAQFATQPVVGDVVILEYFEPAWAERTAEIHVDGVVHAYVDVYGKDDGGVSGSGSCNINVNCALGDDWQGQKRSVAKLFLGPFLCSGALINNTAQDERQLLLTANHCLSGNSNTWTFLFNNEAASCGGGGGPTTDTVVGCQVRASASGSDFALLEITPAIPLSYGVYYSGWDRSGANPTEGTGIHHPSGDIKKICFDDDVVTETFSGTWLWHVSDWEQGVTEGGSSGSPLYDQNQRIVGQLCCGAAACGFLFDDYYGQLDRSWDLGASPWLDPLGTGAATLDGLDAAIPPTPPVLTSVGPDPVPSVLPYAYSVITLSGSNLLGATSVQVNGGGLGAGHGFTVVNDSTITFSMKPPAQAGPIDITVTTPGGSDTLTADVAGPVPPVLRLFDGDTPENLFSFVPVEFTLGGQPGNYMLLYGSPDFSPSTVPGVVDLSIGAGFATLVFVDAVQVPAKAWDEIVFSIPYLAPGAQIHCQAVEWNPVTGALPFATTNVSTGQFLF